VSDSKNRLGEETSPYLLQHADNPVHWQPWGEEALERARTENMPIFLSIGYSACHWCHVMAHESFEDAATAEVMNRHFVNIKVDREERPDLDHIYQTAYQLLAGRGGGWPLSMFLTPGLEPFWGGTYFPNVPRYGMPAFRDMLLAVARTWEDKPEDVRHNAVSLRAGLASMNVAHGSEAALTDGLLEQAAVRLTGNFDPTWGGFGQAPKFPSTMALQFLLRRWYRTGNETTLHVVTHSLAKMAQGGIYDHLAGGFARYSVDEKWLVPHFEKMLYDNALLIGLYTDAWRATGNPLFARVVRESLDYVIRDMGAPDGGFCAAQDADSEGEEGKYYVWRPGEIEEVVGAADAPLFMSYYSVSDAGNFEGQNILWVTEPLEEVAAQFGLSAEAAEARLAGARTRLLARRGNRVPPGRDDKVITSWNGLMIGALARGYGAFGEERWLSAAEAAADFLLTRLTVDGRLLRCYRDGRARFAAYLDDYAFLADGLLELYVASGHPRWLKESCRLMAEVREHFAAPTGGFYFTADDHEELVARTFAGMDQSIPSGNAVAARCMVRLHHLTGESVDLEAAERTVRAFLTHAVSQPLGYSALLEALDELVHPPRTVALVAEPGDDTPGDWQARLGRRYLPDVLLQRLTVGINPVPPVLEGKGTVNGRAAAYVCHAGTCSAPVTDFDALAAGLAAGGSG